MVGRNSVFQDYNVSTCSKYIELYEHKYGGKNLYKSSILGRSSYFDTIKEAQKYIDLVLLNENKPQIYGSFTRK